ncbi:uncharacterized protein [Clytia hemisphaerica]|uniref:Uncharacterized protein n=1 Tax=Clytia hemisphaerica TaxID=252671 RepID=A0A7M5WY18_9CNID
MEVRRRSPSNSVNMESLPSSQESTPEMPRKADVKHERAPKSEDERRQLSDDLRNLDEQSARAARMLVYKRNKYVFLLQSMLLGISYSIIWPTLLPYILEDSAQIYKSDQSQVVSRILYGITYVAYPLGSMVSAKLVEKLNFNTKKMVLFLNMFEICGNLLFTLSMIPCAPAVGRFLAGLGDAFYVVLMKEMHQYTELSNERLTIECLAAFVLGVILSPGINIVTTFMHFSLGSLTFDASNFPGLTAAVLFLIMQFIIAIFIKDHSDEEETNRQKSSSGATPNKFIDSEYIKDLEYTAWFVNGFSFVYTYIVALFELIIPFLMYERLKASTIGVMLLYAIIGTVYAMFLLMTMTVSFDYQPEIFIGISIIVEIAGLSSVLYFTWLTQYTIVADIIGIGIIVVALTLLWSVDDVLFINFVQMFVPYHQREKTHNVRKFMSKLAFAFAGITIPVLYPAILFYFLPVLIVIVCVLFVNFVVIKVVLTKRSK